MNAITTTRRTLAPTPPTREMETLTAIYRSRLERTGQRYSMVESSAPTESERGALEARQSVVVAACIPGERAAIEASVEAMIAGYLSVRVDKDQAKIVRAAYVTHLLTYPLWAVHAGCRACAARDNPFPASPGELRAAVDEAMKPVRQEMHDLAAILSANTYAVADDAARARVSEIYEKFKRDLGLNKAFDPPGLKPQKPPTVAPSVAEWEAQKTSGSPPRLSAAALRACGIEPREPAPAASCPRCIITSGGAVCVSDCPRREQERAA